MWELIFMMVVLKLPIVYLCGVVCWAIKAEPRPEEGAALVASTDLDPGRGPACPWSRRRRVYSRLGPPRPGGSRVRRAALFASHR